MKLFSGKFFVSILAAAAILSIAAVGFSAWLISGSDVPDFQGNVTVDGVTDNSFIVSVGDGEEVQSLHYGAPAEAVGASGWLYSDGSAQESLKLEYNFTFSNYTSGSSFEIDISVADGKDGQIYSSQFADYAAMYAGLNLYDGKEASYECAVSEGFIADVSEATITVEAEENSCLTYENGTFTFVGGTDGSCTAKVTITFDWGELFGGENPYNSYKDLTDGKQRVEAADTLAYLAACLEDVSYKITFVKA